jgi:regulator of RNase E activity RraA
VILGDDDGMVVVERMECESVLEKSIKRIEAEKTKAEKLRAGISSMELNQLEKVFKFLGMVED